jgi:hypothetical protein
MQPPELKNGPTVVNYNQEGEMVFHSINSNDNDSRPRGSARLGRRIYLRETPESKKSQNHERVHDTSALVLWI